MYITYQDYSELGYTAVPMLLFDRYGMRAEACVRRYTFNRITDADLRPPPGATENAYWVAEMNMRGMCELIDAFFMDDSPNSAAAVERRRVVGVTTGRYSETYSGGGRTGSTETAPTIQQTEHMLMDTYFTPEQLYRGVK